MSKRARSEGGSSTMEDTLRERVDALSVTSTAPTPRAERASGAGGAGTASGDVRTGETTVVIGTHSGTFHCDEALACGMLLMLPEYAAASITRTRNPEFLAECDIVVDVGGEYNPETHRYDHHQRGFEETLNEDSDIKLSSAGLVFKHFGRRVISVIVGPEANDAQLSLLEEKLYKSFVREIDAIDNGIEIADEKRYSINTNLSSRVGRVNPAWNEDTSDDVVNAAFKKAVFMTASEFIQVVLGFWTRWMPARSIVEEAFDSAASVHESGKILKLARFCPWKGHLFDIEKEREISEDAAPLYVLFMDSSGAWRVQCVPSAPTGFENRKSLPEPWRGVRDDELSALSGIDGCIFVHAAGFIGGNKTYEGALAMAVGALSA